MPKNFAGDTSEVNISTVAALLERKRTLLDRMPNSPIRIAKTQHDL
jgi:hypothetical protein